MKRALVCGAGGFPSTRSGQASAGTLHFDWAQYKHFDWAQYKHFDWAQYKHFDWAQYKHFDWAQYKRQAQGRPGEETEV